MTLLALTLVVWSGAATPASAADSSPRREAHRILRVAPQPRPREREWLEHAIDRILHGE